jgi:transcription-repair coupling factor (superfamily II helicase)
VDAGGTWLAAQVRMLEGAEISSDTEDYSCAFFDPGLGEFEAGDFIVDEVKRERFFDQLTEWRRDHWSVHLFCNNEGEIERLRELIPSVEADALHFTVGTISRGFTFPAAKVAVLSDAEIFGRLPQHTRRAACHAARSRSARESADRFQRTRGR